MPRILFLLTTVVLFSVATPGCNSGSSSKPGQKSEMERMAEQLEQEKSGKPVAAKPKTQAAATKPSGERDYEAFMLAKYREGVTPENNAAVLFWQAMWPGELGPKEYELVSKELGFQQIPSADGALKGSSAKGNVDRVLKWLRANVQPRAMDNEAYDYIDRAYARPWTSASAPPLAEWLQENNAALDQLVEATKLPRFYSPSSSLLNETDESLLKCCCLVQ